MKIINSIENNSFIFPTNYLPPCFKNNELINGLDDIFARYENIEEILKENFDTKKKLGNMYLRLLKTAFMIQQRELSQFIFIFQNRL